MVQGRINDKIIKDKKLHFLEGKILKFEPSENTLMAIPSNIRKNLIGFYERNLPPDSSSLVLGVVFGIKETLSSNFSSALRTSGVYHVIAASGMNVTLVGGFLASIFTLFLRRQLALGLSILGIIFYAILAGLEPSIIRASIMGIMVLSAQIFGRQVWPTYTLLLTAILMLLFDPGLIFDVGFQLSFLATIGLLYIKPFFNHRILDNFQTTIFAQSATLPVLIANFGYYSIWSVLVNALVLWTVPLIMILGGIAAFFSLIPAIGGIFLWLCLPLLIYFHEVVTFFSKLGGVVTFSSLSPLVTIGYYLILSSLILIRKK